MTHLSPVLLIAACLGAASCNLAPPHSTPDLELPDQFASTGPWRLANPADDHDRGHWWKVFNDRRLTTLMLDAEKGSPTLEAAFHRVMEAQATARALSSDLFPSASLRTDATRSRTTETLQFQFAGGRTRTVLNAGLDLQYELDFWHRARNQSQSASALASQAVADYHSALLSLQSELALNYFALQAQDELIALLQRNVDVRQETVRLARTRLEQGDIARIDVAQAETDLAATEAEAIGLERRRAELTHAIALLLGKMPGDFSLPPLTLADSTPTIPNSVPSDLLERRPDIAAAERNLASLNAEVGVARAALYPRVILGLSGGRQSSFIDQLGNAASRVWALGPAAVDWPVLQGGAARSGVEVARARHDAASANYKQTVLQAMREVEDALSILAILKRQVAAQQNTVNAGREALDLSQKRYLAGLVAYYEVLDAQRTLLRAEQEATRLRGEQQLVTVMLIKALGGAW